MEITGVKLSTTANVYFDGKVVSYTFYTSVGQRYTVGIIFPGIYEFRTSCRERMQITAGFLHVFEIANSGPFGVGDDFEIPVNTRFRVSCDVPTEYICAYLE